MRNLKNFLLNKVRQAAPLMAVFSLPCQGEVGIGECISEIYTVSLTLVGIVAFVQIVWGGFLLLTAAGNTSKVGEAMGKIKNAVLGIVLLFSSYVILRTINPDLINFNFALKRVEIEDTIRSRDLNEPIGPGGSRAEPTDEPIGDRRSAFIESFNVRSSFDLRRNDPLNFSVRIFGNTDGITEVCPNSDQSDNKMKYDLFLVEGNTPARRMDTSFSATGGNIRRFVFGDGKALTFEFTQSADRLRNSIRDLASARSVQFFIRFDCQHPDDRWLNLSESEWETVNLVH